MSLINFLNAKLKPAVYCDAVCEDGYAAGNLIADDQEQLSRGFMGFAVSKPPVEIVFEFPKAVDLKVIKLWNSQGALRSTSFEVYGKHEGIWERVAHVRDLALDVDSVTFCYQSDYSSRSNAGNTIAQQQSAKVFFFRTAHKVLSSTNCLKVTIRATHKCAPVLRKVEVWGLPSRSLEKADRELVRTIWSEVINPYGQCTTSEEQNGQRSPSRSVPELNDDSMLKIPEEFFDAITWELMIFPTVLPSGKVVDQSTIDKHSEVEAKWGRLPSDPFTGLEFTSHRKAILNLALKARIEKFLMDNAQHFKTVPRSLGSSRVRRSRNRHASQFASLYYSVPPVKTPGGRGNISSKLTETPDVLLPAKRARLGSYDAASATYQRTKPASRLLLPSTATQTSATATAPLASAYTAASMSSVSNTAAASSAGASASSLAVEEALQLALQKITRFTCPVDMQALANSFNSCIRCKSEQYAYEIRTCKHLVCRTCLVLLKEEQMCTCETSFRSADVERCHRY